jgi:hypothetical protein
MQLLAQVHLGDEQAARVAATLGDHVGHVVSVGADEQVAWVAARRVVASVTHEQAGRDGAHPEFEGDPVGLSHGPVDLDPAVALAVSPASELKAAVVAGLQLG